MIFFVCGGGGGGLQNWLCMAICPSLIFYDSLCVMWWWCWWWWKYRIGSAWPSVLLSKNHDLALDSQLSFGSPDFFIDAKSLRTRNGYGFG